MKEKPRRQVPLWVLMSACFTLILSLTLLSIILIYRTALSSRYRSGLRDQLYRIREITADGDSTIPCSLTQAVKR